MKEAPQEIFAEDHEEEQNMEIEAPETLYCYLVKSKHQAIFADNWPLFKTAVETHLPPEKAAKLLN